MILIAFLLMIYSPQHNFHVDQFHSQNENGATLSFSVMGTNMPTTGVG